MCVCDQRFIVPALRGSQSVHKAEDPLLEVCRSVDELRRSLAEVVAGLSETQSLMRSQQRQLDDIVRLTSVRRVSIVAPCILTATRCGSINVGIRRVSTVAPCHSK